MKRTLIGLSLILLLSGCAATTAPKNPLVNRGILPLSTNNPYLGSNLAVATEAERSSYLFQFLKSRGAPVAIEIEQDRFSSPHLVMYYPREKEVFVAVLDQRETSYQWVVTGPFGIEREDFRKLAELNTALAGEPVFMIRGQRYRFRFQKEESARRVLVPVLPPEPVHKPAPKKKKTEVVAEIKGEPDKHAPTAAGEVFKPLNSDQQALLMSEGFAERADNGDILHLVKAEHETVNQVARWYTGSEAAAAEILTLNGLAGQELVPGKKIRIPMKALKNTKEMPIDFK